MRYLLSILLLGLTLSVCGQQTSGKVTEHYDNGQVRYIYHLRKGEKHRKHTSWYRDGQMQSVVFFKNGEMNGKAIFYHPDGSLHRVEHYDEGRLHGDLTHYYPDGKLKFFGTYEYDVLQYYRQYLPDGTLDNEEQLH